MTEKITLMHSICGTCQIILEYYGYYENAYQLGCDLCDKMEKNAAFMQDTFLEEEAIQERCDYFQNYDSNVKSVDDKSKAVIFGYPNIS